MIVGVACATGTANTLHQGFFTVVVIYSIVVALWGFVLYLRGSNPSGSFLGALAIVEGVIVLQALIGLALIVTNHRPEDALHWLYGFVAIVALPVAYLSPWTDGGRDRRDSLVFALALLLIVGIALRASATGCTS